MNNPYPGIVPPRETERLANFGDGSTICRKCWGTGKMPTNGRDIPLTKTAHTWRYPLRAMKVGERFFVPNGEKTTEQTQNSLSSSICHIQRNSEMRFTQRRYGHGVRVWRVK